MKKQYQFFRILVVFSLLLTQLAFPRPARGAAEELPASMPAAAPLANGLPISTVQDITYVYTPDGQIQSLSDSERTTTQTSSTESWTYTYDAAQRLTRAQESGGPGGNFDRIYSYDSYGEAEVNDNGFSLNYDFLARDSGESANGYYKPFHAVDRVSDDASGAVLFSYRYDAAGNMIKRYTTTPAKTETFGYDAENRLTSYGDGSAVGVSFFYDDQGSMIQKKVDTGSNATRRITYYVGNYYEYVTDGNGTAISTARYYYAGMQRIAMRQGSGEMQFFASNHLGSTETVFSATGTVNASTRYNPFGGTRYTSAGGFPSAYQYTGQRAIGEVGLIYFNARWLDSQIGHFTQPDSVVADKNNPLDWDRFSYTVNDPVNRTDPDGHRDQEDCPDCSLAGASWVEGEPIPTEEQWTVKGKLEEFNKNHPEFDSETQTKQLGSENIEQSQEGNGRPDLFRGGNPASNGNQGDPNFTLRTQNNKNSKGDFDIIVDDEGYVSPGGGGLSTRSEAKPNWKAPWKYPSTSPSPEGVNIFQDKPSDDPLHWLWEPAWKMPLDQFKDFLKQSLPNWIAPAP